MNCSIKGTLTSNVIQASSRQVEPGYFDTDRFIDQFGEWRAGKLSEAEIAANAALPRFNEDGSPRLDLNKYGVPFFTDKFGVRTPVIGEAFSSLPLEIRSEVSDEIMNAVVADLLLDYLGDNEEFLAGEKVENFNLSDYYDERVNEYWNLGMTDQALISTKESKQDYLDGINAKLKNLGVKVTNDAIKQAQSIERPTTDKASPTIKAIMQFVPRVDQAGERIDSKNIPNNATYMKASEVWGVVLSHMADIPMENDKDMIEVYLTRLSELEVTHPWVSEIIEKIDEGGQALKIQFVTALNNVKNNVNITTYDGGKYATINAVASSTSRNKIVSEWATIIKNTSDSISDNQAEAIGFDQMAAVQEALENLPEVTNEDEIGDALQNMHEVLSPFFGALNIGIEENITVGAYNVHLEELHRGKAGEIDYLDGYKSFVRATKDAWVPVMGQTLINPSDENLAQFGNAMMRFAQSTVNVEDDSGVHMVTVGKNRIYVYSLPSVLQEQINAWKANPTEVQDLVKELSVKNSRLLNHLANPNNLSQMKVGMRGVITRKSSTGKVEAKDGKEISKGDYAKVDFYNTMRMLGSDNKRSPIYNTQVPADKGKEFQLEVPGFFTETDSMESAAQAFVPYVTDEFNQMRQAVHYISSSIDQAVSKLPEGYLKEQFAEPLPGQSSADILSKVATDSYPAQDQDFQDLFKGLIEEVKNDMIVNYHLSKRGDLMDLRIDSETLGMYLGSAFNYTTAASINDIKGLKNPISGLPLPQDELILTKDDQIRTDIAKVMEDAVRNKTQAWKETASSKYGIFIEADGSVNGIDTQVYNYYEQKAESTELATKMNEINDAIMRDFVTNYMISKIEYAKLFTGDLSYYKSISDYIKRVPATYIDGLQPVTGIEEGDETFTQMTFATEELVDVALSYDTENLDANARSHYAKVDRTDAQGYITPKRWRQLVLSIGKLGPSAQVVFDKITKQGELTEAGKPLTADVMLTPKEIKILSAQPLKGVYFKNEIGGSPTYLKYSQAVLLPQFVNNNPKARQLLTYMKEHGVDEMVAQTGVKVGALRPQPLFDEAGDFIATNNPRIVTLDSKNWRLQQDLPTKMIKDNKIGVQVQKIIMSGLAFSGDQQLLQQIQNALGDLSDVGMAEFYTRYGITAGANGSAKITDVQKFYETLIEDVQAKEVPEDNVLRALKSEVPISLLPMLKQPLQNQIFSTLRKAATNLMTPGGSYIQISDQLIGKTEITKRGIKMFKPIDRLSAPSVTTDGNGRKTLIPGEVLIPHSLIYKLLPNYQSMTTEELNKAVNEELREIIGYRIPTQAKASVDILEIVGILPPELGDSIITYGEITAKTGSDFDIDKMFFMMRDMELNEQGVIEAVAEFSTKTYKAQQGYTTDRIVEIEVESPIAGVDGVNKPDINITLLSNKELVDLDDAKSIIEHEKIKSELEDLEELIKCIW